MLRKKRSYKRKTNTRTINDYETLVEKYPDIWLQEEELKLWIKAYNPDDLYDKITKHITPKQLDRIASIYPDLIDWQSISADSYMPTNMLIKYARYIDWDIVSDRHLTLKEVRELKEYLNWDIHTAYFIESCKTIRGVESYINLEEVSDSYFNKKDSKQYEYEIMKSRLLDA